VFLKNNVHTIFKFENKIKEHVNASQTYTYNETPIDWYYPLFEANCVQHPNRLHMVSPEQEYIHCIETNSTCCL
jgi:hypothetical protein